MACEICTLIYSRIFKVMQVSGHSQIKHFILYVAKSLINVSAIGVITLMTITSSVKASPWLEANDPFLRSSVVLLSDAGKLTAPVNHYPARWSFYGDDLKRGISDSKEKGVAIASRELQYSLSSAKLNRGNTSIKFIAGKEQPINSGFGDFSDDKWGGYTSYEHLDNSYAFRFTTGYRDYNGERDIDWSNSYLSLNAGAWLFSISNVKRWWGQGWQHNLILGSFAKTAPDASLSYLGQNAFLGFWSIETLWAFPSDSPSDYHSATRLVSKPFSNFEYGLTYQAWFDDLNVGQGAQQSAFDAKLTLPHIGSLYHSVYTELASTDNASELGAWMIGWTGSFLDVGKNNVRIVLEAQQATSAHDNTRWKIENAYQDYPSQNKNVSNTTYQLDSSESIAIYFQMYNDHNIGVIYQQSEMNNQSWNSSQLIYRLPALAGMLHFGAGYTQNDNSNNETNIWSGYEFRI